MPKLSPALYAAAAAGALLTGSIATAAPVVIEDFATADGAREFGLFGRSVQPGGSNVGQASGTTSISLTQFEFTPEGQTAYFNQLSQTDNPAAPGGNYPDGTSAWFLRHLANGGSKGPANTLSETGPQGYVGYYLRTLAPNLVTAIVLDEVGGSGGIEVSTRADIINDGEWHLYQFSLEDINAWDGFLTATGNGVLDGTAYSIDSVAFWQEGPDTGTTAQFDFAYVVYDADAPLVSLVPEPASAALLIAGGALLMGRRRQA